MLLISIVLFEMIRSSEPIASILSFHFRSYVASGDYSKQILKKTLHQRVSSAASFFNDYRAENLLAGSDVENILAIAHLRAYRDPVAPFAHRAK